jgi:hypothetical protein
MSMMPLPPSLMTALPAMMPAAMTMLPVGTTPVSPGQPPPGPIAAQRPPSVESASGQTPGEVFDGKGNNFLDPNTILREVNGFTSSLPSTSPGPFGDNPDSSKILSTTTQSLSQILKGPVILPNTRIPVLPGPFPFPVPDFSSNPDADRIGLGTLFFINNLLPSRPPVVNSPPPPSGQAETRQALLQLLQQLLGILQTGRGGT